MSRSFDVDNDGIDGSAQLWLASNDPGCPGVKFFDIYCTANPHMCAPCGCEI